MKLLVGIVASIVLNIGLTFIGQGRFIFDILILAACIWVAAPLFLFSGIFLAIAYRKPNPVMISIGQWMLLASIVLGSTLMAAYFGGLLNDKRINEAKVYCEELAVQLDKARDTAGVYPTNLTMFIEHTPPPRILQNGNLYYHSQGSNYSITFSDPGGMMNGWDFIGSTKEWHRFD